MTEACHLSIDEIGRSTRYPDHHKELACKTDYHLFSRAALINPPVPHVRKSCAPKSAPAESYRSSWKRMMVSPPRSLSAQGSKASGRLACLLPAPWATAMPTKRRGANS